MKKHFAIFASAMLLFSCSSKQVELTNLAAEYIGTPTSQNNCIYKYNSLQMDQCVSCSVHLKGKIDKELGMLPTKENAQGVRATGHICENYEWEKTDRYVSLWIDYTDFSVEIIDRTK